MEFKYRSEVVKGLKINVLARTPSSSLREGRYECLIL